MSDIVDSTRRWNTDEAAMAADLELHDHLVRRVVEAAGGSVFKHTGDGMIAVFDDPVAAVGAAAGVQQAIGDAIWQHPDGVRVRAAVHTGVVYARDGDLFGSAVNRLARLLGVCPPGAALVSSATAALLVDRAPEGIDVRPVGSVHLSGFASPETAHAVVGAGVAHVDALPSAHTATGATPGGPTIDGTPLSVESELVGRADELAAIGEAIGRAPLVTLVGVGGMGKTRLALEIAIAESARSTTWWIDLTGATSDRAVLPVVMTAMGARDTAGRTQVQAITDRLGATSGLVVLDNCEHVLATVRDLVAAILAACPQTRVVCTSREALGLRREQIVPVGSLSTDEGVTLFCERALAVRPDLDPVATNEVIARICQRLDGIPLAIELAAARCRAMTPAEIDERLDDRFRLLRGGRTGAERHRTLRATVDWSYSSLDDDERAVFEQMAVFAGGTLIDGLTAVTGLDEFDLLDIVDRLVSRSMVVATSTPLGTRYHQLETLRQYAEDRLAETSRLSEALDRHLEWMQAFTRQLPRRGDQAQIIGAFARFAAEIDNLRVAVAHALGSGRSDVAHALVATVARFAYLRPAFEVFDWARPSQLDDDASTEAALCAAYGAYADFFRGDRQSVRFPIGGVPERFLASSLPIAALQALTLLQSDADWERAVGLMGQFATTSDTVRLIVGRTHLLALFYRQCFEDVADDEFASIIADGDEVLALARRLGDPVELSSTLHYHAWALTFRDPHRAIETAREGAELAERIGAIHLADTIRTVESFATGLLLQSGQPLLEQLVELREQLATLLEQRNLFPAAVHTVALVPMLLTTAPELARQVHFTWTDYTGLDYFALAVRMGLIDAATITSVNVPTRRAALPDTISEVLAELDRIIAGRSV